MASEKRLIDAWDLIEWLDDFDRENTLRVLMGKKAKLLNSHAIKNMIVTVPTVDAVEVVRGYNLKQETWGDDGFECSVCGYEDWDCMTCDPQHHNYCPNCGAKMDGDGNGKR